MGRRVERLDTGERRRLALHRAGHAAADALVENFIDRLRDDCLKRDAVRVVAKARAVLDAWCVGYNPASQHPSVYAVDEKRFC